MADNDAILWLIVVLFGGCCACLLTFLCIRLQQHQGDYPLERQWPGHGIDTTLISNRVRRVRHDYVAELQSRTHRPGRGGVLNALVRRAIARLPYFRARQLHAAAPKNESENDAV